MITTFLLVMTMYGGRVSTEVVREPVDCLARASYVVSHWPEYETAVCIPLVGGYEA